VWQAYFSFVDPFSKSLILSGFFPGSQLLLCGILNVKENITLKIMTFLKLWQASLGKLGIQIFALEGFTVYSFSNADIMGKLSADPLFCCISRTNQSYF
jgi:hypothetical protein